MKEEEIYDVLILGAGPAGVTAGIYAKRYGMKTLVIGKDYGQMGESYRIDNYPGLPGITGLDLAQRFIDHLTRTGAKLITDEVINVNRRDDIFVVKTNDGEYKGRTIIIALGGKRRELNIPGEKEYYGKGVSGCATCDAPFYKDKITCVIGGADSAVSAAILLSKFSRKVYIFYRRKRLRAKQALIDELKTIKNIEVVYESVPKEMLGDGIKITGIKLEVNRKIKEYDMDGIFIEVGYRPNTEPVYPLNINTDEKGYIIVDKGMRTNVHGAFAAGDITTGSNLLLQIITACAEGAIAATSAYTQLRNNS